MPRKADLIDILDVLYEGMLDDAAWQRGLAAVSDFVSGSAVALFSMDPSNGHVYRADIARVDPSVMRQYGHTWIHHDPRHAAGLGCSVGEPQVDGMLVDARAYRRTAIYNEFLRPADIPFHLATWVERTPTRGVVLTVQGSRSRGAFSDADRHRMAMLIPHVRRVVEAKDRLALAQTTAGRLLETMDRLPFGLLLLGDDGEILEASRSVRPLLQKRAGIHADGGRLGFVRHADRRAFDERLEEDKARARLDDIVRVELGDGRSLSLLVLPVSFHQQQWLARASRWMVLVLDSDLRDSPPAQVLRRLLGIGPAEAALARLLAMGMSMAEATEQLGLSRNTTRTQLKSIFAKTGIRSQAQLVHRILTDPMVRLNSIS